MALMTPIALPINAFDANENQTFAFTVNGGSQVVKNKLTIRRNSDDVVVFTSTLESYGFNQVVPADTLVNGTYYNFYFNTYDVDGNESADSNVVPFYCFTTPTLAFTNITTGDTIEAPQYTFNLTYNQIEDELLNELHFYLYDAHGKLLKASETIYSSDNPPINFEYTFSGLTDKENYYVEAVATTLHGFVVESNRIGFFVSYGYKNTYFVVKPYNECIEGRVRIETNIVSIDGQMNREPEYIDHSALVIEQGDWLLWNDGFKFSSHHFVMTKWWKPVELGTTTVVYGDTYANRIEVTLKRYGTSDDKENIKGYIQVDGYYNGVKYFMKCSNLVEKLNNNSELVSYVNIDNSRITVMLLNKNTITNQLQWNVLSNLEFNRLTDLYFEDTSLSFITRFPYKLGGVNNFGTRDSLGYDSMGDGFYHEIEPFNILNIKLLNGIVDHFNISSDTDKVFVEQKPQWDLDTILDCDFDDNIRGGNVGFTLQQVDMLKLKRRVYGTVDWITIFKQNVSTIDDLNFDYKDYYLTSNQKYEYAIVPCLHGAEFNYLISEVDTKFNGIFVSDNTDTIRLIGGAMYPADNITQQIGILQPYNKQYPKIITNPNIKYRTLTVTGDVLPFDEDNILDRRRGKIVELRKRWEEFLTNGKPKVVKDWNGDVILGKVTVPPSATYIGQDMIIPMISFTITEQGKYDSQEDMYNNGFYSFLDA